jgi:peptidoglycan/xylan/chitin deacetylase (PgdA/CDA1 family)
MFSGPRKSFLPLARKMNLGRMISLSGQTAAFPFYHGVADEELPHIRHVYTQRNVSQFVRDLDHMLKQYEAVSLKEYLEGPEHSRQRNRMVLSFDDGLAECHSVIAPVLQRKGVPAVFFLNNAFIGNQDLFYRYKVSLLMDAVLNESRSLEKAAACLRIDRDMVVKALLIMNYAQDHLLDVLAAELGLDFKSYLKKHPVYMSESEVKHLVMKGFEIGGHSLYHADFASLDETEVLNQVDLSIMDLRLRFGIDTRYFSFPFTTAGIPGKVIRKLLEEERCQALFGTAGLKKNGTSAIHSADPYGDRSTFRRGSAENRIPLLPVQKYGGQEPIPVLNNRIDVKRGSYEGERVDYRSRKIRHYQPLSFTGGT